jgi:hypothetical protein
MLRHIKRYSGDNLSVHDQELNPDTADISLKQASSFPAAGKKISPPLAVPVYHIYPSLVTCQAVGYNPHASLMNQKRTEYD